MTCTGGTPLLRFTAMKQLHRKLIVLFATALVVVLSACQVPPVCEGGDPFVKPPAVTSK